MKTHKVLDLIYTEEEGQDCFVGTLQECIDFVSEQDTIGLQNKRLKISSKSDSGWFEEETNFKYDGDPITFAITPYLLKDILLETSTCIFAENRLKFSGEGWEYLSMLKTNVGIK